MVLRVGFDCHKACLRTSTGLQHLSGQSKPTLQTATGLLVGLGCHKVCRGLSRLREWVLAVTKHAGDLWRFGESVLTAAKRVESL